MSTSSYLYGQASVKAMRAERCRAAADALDRRRAALTERHRPVVALHTEAVWKGRAATSSRMRLHRVIGAALYSLGLDLATTSRGAVGCGRGPRPGGGRPAQPGPGRGRGRCPRRPRRG